MRIKLFLTDFQSIVRHLQFNSETNVHPVFYFETADTIFFYKPVEFVMYYVELQKNNLPKDIIVDTLKAEFRAIEMMENSINNPVSFERTRI